MTRSEFIVKYILRVSLKSLPLKAMILEAELVADELVKKGYIKDEKKKSRTESKAL